MSRLESSDSSAEARGSSIPAAHSVWRDALRVLIVTLVTAFLLKSFVVEAFRIPSASMENTLHVGDFLLVNKLAYGLRTPRFHPSSAVSIPSIHLPLFRSIRRGDVIVFEYPGDRDEVHPEESVNYIKRCIGLPGDTVGIRAGIVYVNGSPIGFPSEARQPLSEGRSSYGTPDRFFPAREGYTETEYGPIIVPRHDMEIVLADSTIERWRVLIAREGHAIAVNGDGRIVIDGRITDRYRISRDYYFVLGDNRPNSRDSRYWGFVPEDNVVGEAMIVYWSWEEPIDGGGMKIRWERVGRLIR